MQTRLELYHLVTSLAGLGIWERNLKTGEFFWNTIIREIYEVGPGYAPDMEESIRVYKDPQRMRNLISKAISTREPETDEVELITLTGKLKWVKVRIGARFENDECTSIYGTLEDITADMILLRTSEEREQRFFQAFTNAPIGMALVSPKGEWIKVNNSLCKLLGYSEQEFIQHTFQEFTHSDDLDIDLRQMHQLLNKDIESYSMEKRYFHRKGHVIWALLNVSLVRDSGGNPLYFVSQIKDISEQKQHLETIKEQNNRLINFAHIVSHNLRSHTGNIHMLTDMITGETDAEERNRLVRMLNQSTTNLLETLAELNEVVDVKGKDDTVRKNLNLREQIERVLEILAGSIRLAGAIVEIDIDAGMTILFNPAYLESIVMNLVSNSIKYRSPDRILQITISAKLSAGKIKLQITDNGMGIDLALHKRNLFGMYKTFHGNEDAHGIGLFLVKSQVEAMGGQIFVQSEVGAGTSFTIDLPKH